jgi:hypothetical protein
MQHNIYVRVSTNLPVGDSRQGQEIFSTPWRPDELWDPHSRLQVCTGGSFLGGKVAGHEADHSPLSSVEVKNGGATQPHTHVFLE